jgi:hypothetical protein
MPVNKLILGDNLEILKTIEADSVDGNADVEESPRATQSSPLPSSLLFMSDACSFAFTFQSTLSREYKVDSFTINKYDNKAYFEGYTVLVFDDGPLISCFD